LDKKKQRYAHTMGHMRAAVYAADLPLFACCKVTFEKSRVADIRRSTATIVTKKVTPSLPFDRLRMTLVSLRAF